MKNKNNSEKRKDYRKIVGVFVFASLILAIIGIVVMMIIAPSEPKLDDPNGHIKSDYVLMLVQCILGVVVILLPGAIEKRIRIEIPSNMMVLYILFIYAAIFLGEVRSFYYIVPHFDTLLHTFSGGMIATLGFSIIAFLNNSDKIPVTLSPLFVACFTFCFALALGGIWEIYEFLADGVLSTNMQKFALEDGTQLIGRAAVTDTMKDIIVDAIGAFVISAVGYISLKYKKGWIEKVQIRKVKKSEENEDDLLQKEASQYKIETSKWGENK